jgi:hypothetical protein
VIDRQQQLASSSLVDQRAPFRCSHGERLVDDHWQTDRQRCHCK